LRPTTTRTPTRTASSTRTRTPTKTKTVPSATPTPTSSPTPGSIVAVAATYAANCGAPTDVSSSFQNCLGLQVCTIGFSAPDPALGCAKDLDVEFNCGGEPNARQIHVSPEAQGTQLELSCVGPAPTPASTPTPGIPPTQVPGNCCSCDCGGAAICYLHIQNADDCDTVCACTATFVPDAACSGGGCIAFTPTLTRTLTPTRTPTVTPTRT
jgi:hypothetical protein